MTGKQREANQLKALRAKTQEVILPSDCFPNRNCNINSSRGLQSAGLPHRVQTCYPRIVLRVDSLKYTNKKRKKLGTEFSMKYHKKSLSSSPSHKILKAR